MASRWKTVPIFVSSTFVDMQAERDHLVRFVFPRLREELLRYRLHLAEVDLRWGVTSANAVGVCKQIIDECRPRFLCMLGERYGSVPEGETESVTASEIHYAGLKSQDMEYFFYFRDPATTASMVEVFPGEYRGQEGSSELRLAEQLKQEVLDAGFEPFYYSAHWDTRRNRLVGLEQFGKNVYDDLLRSILAEVVRDEAHPSDEITQLRDAMQSFVDLRSDSYVEGVRRDLCQDLDQFVSGNSAENVCLLVGEPGSGKSALLARLVRKAERDLGSRAVVISHFAGAGPGSSDIRLALRSLTLQLASAMNVKAPAEEAMVEMIRSFSSLLHIASRDRRVVLIFDALNQLDPSDNAYSMLWLPTNLPLNVRVVLSSVQHPVLTQTRLRFAKSTDATFSSAAAVKRIQRHVLGMGEGLVEKVIAPLNKEEAGAIIRAFLARYHKDLSVDQMRALHAKKDAERPLYLTLALEELRSLGTYQEIGDRINDLPGTIQSLFQWIVFTRLPAEPTLANVQGELVGGPLITKLTCCLAVSRSGLSAREITDLLEPGDPLGNVAALVRLLNPYLIRRGSLLDFYHGEFRETIRTGYLADIDSVRSTHAELAAYFRRRGLSDRHALSELPFHLVGAADPAGLTETLTAISFVEAKVTAGMIGGLLADYNLALKSLDLETRQSKALDDFASFLRGNLHILSGDPSLTFQQAANEPVSSAPAAMAAARSAQGLESRPWVNWINKPRNRSSRQLTLAADPDGVVGIAYSADGQRIYTIGFFGAIRLWDSWTGVEIANAEAPRDQVTGFALSPKEDRLAIISKKGFVRIFDLNTLAETKHSPGIHVGVKSCAFDEDGNTLVTAGGRDPKAALPSMGKPFSRTSLQVWSSQDGKHLRTPWALRKKGKERALSVRFVSGGRLVLLDHSMGLRTYSTRRERGLKSMKKQDVPDRSCAAVSTSGQDLLWGTDDGMVLMRSIAKNDTAQLSVHRARVSCLEFSPIEHWAASGGDDGLVALIDTQSKSVVGGFTGHSGAILCCAFSPDAKSLATGSVDGHVIIWSLASPSRESESMSAHNGPVCATAFSSDGSLAASGADDGTLRVWRPDGHSERFFRIANGSVTSIAFHPSAPKLIAATSDGFVTVVDLASGIASPLPIRRPVPKSNATRKRRLLDALSLGSYGIGLGLMAGGLLATPLTAVAAGIELLAVLALAFAANTILAASFTSSNLRRGLVAAKVLLVVTGIVGAIPCLYFSQPLDLIVGSVAGIGLLTAIVLIAESTFLPLQASTSVAYSPDGDLIAVGRASGEVIVMPSDLSRPAQTLAEGSYSTLKQMLETESKGSHAATDALSILSLAFSSASQELFLATTTLAGPAGYRIPSGQPLPPVGPTGVCHGMTISPARERIAFVTSKGVRVYSEDLTKSLVVLAASPPQNAAFRSEASIAASYEDGLLVIHDLASGRPLFKFLLDSQIKSLACSPRGNLMSVGDAFGRLHLLKLENLSHIS